MRKLVKVGSEKMKIVRRFKSNMDVLEQKTIGTWKIGDNFLPNRRDHVTDSVHVCCTSCTELEIYIISYIISKNEQVTGIFVSQLETKSQFYQIFKSQNLNQFLRSGPNFLHVSSISIEVQHLNSNLGSYTTPSLTY